MTASVVAASIVALGGPASAAAGTPAMSAPAVDLVVSLPLRNVAELETLVRNQSDERSPLYHHFLTPAQFRAAFGPTADRLKAAADVMTAAGFTVMGTTTQSIKVRGSADAVARTFGVTLHKTADNAYRAVGAVAPRLPAALATSGAVVTGLSAHPPKHTFSHRVKMNPADRIGIGGYYFYDDLVQAYEYPSFTSGFNGKGVTVGIVIDSAVDPADLGVYLQAEKFTQFSKQSLPTVTNRIVLGGAPVTSSTNPYNPNGDGVEAALDMEQALGSASGASAIVYDIPSLTDDAIVAGYIDAVEDNKVDIVSSSFGGCELQYSAAYNGGTDMTGTLALYHSIFLQGNAQGITFVAASGDEAGKECPSVSYAVNYGPGTFVPSVSTPASDPNVTAVGGTNLLTSTPPPSNPGSLASTYINENAFGDPQYPYDPYGYGANVSGGVFGSGSGTSAYYARPSYQKLVSTRSAMRTVPDVAMHMGGCPVGSIVGGSHQLCGYAPPVMDKQPRSYDIAYYGPVGGLALIGTSAAAPEFAGLLARKAQTLHSRLGNANTLIYEMAAANNAFPMAQRFFHQGIPAYNGIVLTGRGGSGYNPVVGNGTPIAENFLGLANTPLAGNPQTASNP